MLWMRPTAKEHAAGAAAPPLELDDAFCSAVAGADAQINLRALYGPRLIQSHVWNAKQRQHRKHWRIYANQRHSKRQL